MKKRWKEILLIVVAATVILGMGSTAVDNFKNIFNGNKTEEKPTEETAAIVYVEEAL